MKVAVKPKRTRLSPEKRRTLILDHTAEIIGREGVAGLSIERVSKEAGISKSLVYNYFTNLHQLLVELLERELRRLRSAQAKAAANAATFEELVRSLTHVYLKYIDERGLIIERLQSEPSVSEIHDPTEYSRDAAVDFLAKIVSKQLDLPFQIARAGTEISFGLPASAGAYLNRKELDLQQVEDLAVTMILGTFSAIKNDHMLRTGPLEIPRTDGGD